MPLVCVACSCGSSDQLIRNALRRYGYSDFLNIPVTKGKDKSLSVLSSLPQLPEVQTLQGYIKSKSRFAVILGYEDSSCRWADVASPNPKESIEAELITKHFG